MRLLTVTLTGGTLVLALAGSARAEDETPETTAHPLRVGVAGTAGYGKVHRSSSDPSSEGTIAYGGELRVHPYSPHGFVVAYTYAAGIFGPNVSIVDGAYSLRVLGPKKLRDFAGALYFDVGPSVGFVSHAPPASDHTVLGGRVSIAADAQIWNFTLGPVLSYRGGVPLSGAPDNWEGALTVFLRAGLVFDVGR
jgi:hypothetical protein